MKVSRDPRSRKMSEDFETYCRGLERLSVDSLAPPVHLVSGNESGDLDSYASALGYAYKLSKDKPDCVVVPVLPLTPDQPLQHDVAFLLDHLSLSPSSVHPLLACHSPSCTASLVDHHTPHPPLQPDQVVTVIDHHDNPPQYPEEVSVTVEGVGSCSTLVCECWGEGLTDPALATLLLGAILMDTLNLESERTTDRDRAAVATLSTHSKMAVDELFAALCSKRFGRNDDSPEDLLRRDAKQVSCRDAAVVLSSITCPSHQLLPDPAFLPAVRDYLQLNSAHLAVIMFISLDQEGKTLTREVGVVQEGRVTDLAEGVAAAIEESYQCQRTEEGEGLVLIPLPSHVSRKKLLPKVVDLLNSMVPSDKMDSFVMVSISDSPPEEDKPAEEDKPVEEEIPVEEDKPVEEEIPVEEDKPVEEEIPAEDDKPVEEEISPEEDLPVEDDKPVEEEIPPQEDKHLVVEDVGSLVVVEQKEEVGKTEEDRVGEEGVTSGSEILSVEDVSATMISDVVRDTPTGQEDITPTLTPTMSPVPAATLDVQSSLLDPPLEPSVTVIRQPSPEEGRGQKESPREPRVIPEIPYDEEVRESRNFRVVRVGGHELRIDLQQIQPYRGIVEHAGYVGRGSTALIILQSRCLPPKSLPNYNQIFTQVFYYVLSTVDSIVVDDYEIVYVHGDGPSNTMPSFKWFREFYQMIDRRLRKNLRRLYIVRPTFWIKAMLKLAKPFISAKFFRKIATIATVEELSQHIPVKNLELVFPQFRQESQKVAVSSEGGP